MASVNKCIFIGNLTKDPEIRYMSSGEAVANFSIACNDSWKDKNGQKQERTEYVNVVAYRKLAEIIGEYLKKGRPIYIEGRMQTRKWQTKEGQDRYTTEIVCDQMQMLGGVSGDTGASNRDGEASNQNTSQQNNSSGSQSSNFDEFEDNIPFN